MSNEKEFEFEVIENIAVLSDSDKLMKMFGRVSWNGKEPVFDIRTWKKLPDDGVRGYKGITLNIDELKALKTALNEMEL